MQQMTKAALLNYFEYIHIKYRVHTECIITNQSGESLPREKIETLFLMNRLPLCLWNNQHNL